MSVHTHNNIKKLFIALGGILLASILLLSCEVAKTTPKSSNGSAALFTVLAKVGDSTQATVQVTFNEAIGKVDTSKFTISKDISTAINIDPTRLNAQTANTLEIDKVFYWDNTVHITVKGAVTTQDTIVVRITQGAVYNTAGASLVTTEVEEKGKAQEVPAKVIATIAAPGTNKLYVLYDTQIKTVAAAAKFTINSGKKSNLTENLVTGTSIVDKARTKEVKQALAQYGYILEESGLSIEDVLGYVIELIVTTPLQVGETTESSMEADAVKSISSKETPAESGITGTVEEDTSPPKLQSIAITSTTEAQSIELLFDKTITVLAQDKIIVQEGNNFFRITTATRSKTNSKELQITLANSLEAGATIKVTLEAGAVQDIAGNSNEVDSTGKTGTVGNQIPTDTTAPTMTEISANDSSNTTVIVEFSEAVKNIDKDKFAVSNNGVQQIIDKAEVGTGTDAKKVTLTLKGAFSKGNKIAVTLGVPAVVDNAGNANTKGSSTTTVLDTSKPILQDIRATTANTKVVVVGYNEAVKNPNKANIKVTIGSKDQTINSVQVGTGDKAKEITLTLAEVFKAGDMITVTLEAGAVADNADNASAKVSKTTTVLDESLPYIISVSANDGANTKVIVEFSESVKDIDATKFKVQVEQGTGSASAASAKYKTALAIPTNNAKTVTGDAKKVELTLESAFTVNNTIKVTLEAGAVADTADNKNVIDSTGKTAIVSDGTAPTISKISANESKNTTVIVEFSEAVTKPDNSKFRVQINSGGLLTPSTAVAGADENKVTLTLATAFTVGNTIKVTLEAGAVEDTTKNKNVKDSTGKTATVSDGIAPTMTGISANDGADKTVIVEFSEAVTVEDATKFKIQVLQGSGSKSAATGYYNSVLSSIKANNATIVTGDTKKVRLTLEREFTINNTITITLEAGAVADTADNKNVIDSTGKTATVSDGTAPTISKIIANESKNTTVIVEFSEAVKNPDQAKIKVTIGSKDQTINSVQVGTGDKAKEITLTLAEAFKAGDTIKVTLEAGAVQDTANNQSDSTSKTITAIDNKAPTISKISANDGANMKIIVEFSKDVTLLDAIKFKVQVLQGTGSANPATTNYKTATPIDGSHHAVANGKEVTLSIQSTFSKDNIIKVTLEAGAVADTADNKNVIDSTGKTATVSDGIVPTISKIHASTIADKTVIVEFSEAIAKPDTSKFRVQINDGVLLTPSDAQVDATDNNKIKLTISSAFAKDDTIKVTLLAGAVEDKAAPTPNKSLALSSATGLSTTRVIDATADTTAPIISAVIVHQGAPTQVIVVFNEAVKNPNKANFKITKKTSGNTAYTAQTINGTPTVGIANNANRVTLTLASAFNTSDTIKATLLSNAVQDLAGNANEADSTGKEETVATTGILLYKPYDQLHHDKFSIGDYNSNALFGIRGLIVLKDTKAQYAVNIKNGTTAVYSKAKTTLANNVPASGNFDIGIDMTYAKWKEITDKTDLTIQVTVYDSTGKSVQLTKTLSATRTADGNIYSWRGLQNMEDKPDGTYILQNDIVFPTAGTEGFPTAGFVPIGNGRYISTIFQGIKFSGLLKGNNKTITGLYINNSTLDNAGLFGYIRKTGNTDIAVQNLTLHNTHIKANSNVGALVGNLSHAKVTAIASTVDSDKQTSHIIEGAFTVGGLVGVNDQGSTEGYTTGNVKGTSTKIGTGSVGGLVGSSTGIILGYTTGNISGKDDVGGLVGYTESGVEVKGYSTGNISGKNDVGGLVGHGFRNGSFSGYATGNVSGTENVGGLIGNKDASGTVSGYVLGNVSGTGDNVGGLVGLIEAAGTVLGYALGYVSGPKNVGIGIASIGDYFTNNNLVDAYIYAGHTSAEDGLETGTGTGKGAGTGDHVGTISTTAPTSAKTTIMAPTRWIIEGSGTNTASKFYSKNKASFEVTDKVLTFSNKDWDFKIDSSKQWPILNVPASLATGHTQDPKIPAKPTNFHE